MSDRPRERTQRCIRCDEETSVEEVSDYISLTFNQETGCFPMCKPCFEEVRGRDLWQR